MTVGNPVFCHLMYLTAVHFRGDLQHVGDVIEQKSTVDQSELEKYRVSDCKTDYKLVIQKQSPGDILLKSCSEHFSKFTALDKVLIR